LNNLLFRLIFFCPASCGRLIWLPVSFTARVKILVIVLFYNGPV